MRPVSPHQLCMSSFIKMDSQDLIDMSPLPSPVAWGEPLSMSPTFDPRETHDSYLSPSPQDDPEDMDYSFPSTSPLSRPYSRAHVQQQQCISLSHILPPNYTHTPPATDSSVVTKIKSTPAPTTPSNKRAASPYTSPDDDTPPPPKRPRAPPSGPISTKDFVPPDVSGLSKREARLVKNRAAAFLSRQRKREEFELMEQYVFSNSIFSRPLNV